MKPPKKKKTRALLTSEGQKPTGTSLGPWSSASNIYQAKGCLSADGYRGKADSALTPQVWQGTQNTSEGDLRDEGTQRWVLEPAESSGGSGLCHWEEMWVKMEGIARHVCSHQVCVQQALKDSSEALSSEEFVPREAAGLIIGLKRSGAPTILSWTKVH